MIGLDTNVLVRYLMQDNPIQSPRATEPIEGRLSEAEPGFVSLVAMAEVVWVLDRAYGLAGAEIAAALEQVLQADVLVVENEREVFEAMIALRDGEGAVSDALIAALGARAGCARTFTFDRRASALAGMGLLS